MKFIITALTLILLSAPVQAKNDWRRVESFAVGSALGAGLHYCFGLLGADKNSAMWDSFAVVTMIGAAKELYFDESPDSKDFTANELGALVGVSISVLAF